MSKRYRHNKRGTVYEIVCEAVWEPTEVAVFVYRDMDTGKVWVRPKAEFFEVVDNDGQQMPRFSEVLSA